MDHEAFDRLSRAIAGRDSRRRAVALLGGGLVGALLGLARREPAGAYPDDCRRFVLSGGKKKGKEIDVDDDLSVYLNNDRIFHDNDGVIGIDLEPIQPIKFRARVGDKLRIVAKDGQGPCRSLSALWLHCRDGGNPVKLTSGVRESCKEGRPPRTFFDETYRI